MKPYEPYTPNGLDWAYGPYIGRPRMDDQTKEFAKLIKERALEGMVFAQSQNQMGLAEVIGEIFAYANVFLNKGRVEKDGP